MRRISHTKDNNFTKKILHNKLIINLFLIFLLLEFIFLPYTVTSLTTSDGLDTNGKTYDSGDSSSVVDDSKVDSSGDSVVVSDSTVDSSGDSAVVDDKDSNVVTEVIDDNTYDSTSGSAVVEDNSYNSSGNFLNVNKKPTRFFNNSIIEDDKLYYAPNERIVPTEEIISITENELGDLSSGTETEVQMEYTEDIDSVKLTPTTNLNEVKVTIIKLKDKSEEIVYTSKKNTSIYTYLDIKLIANDTYVEEKDIQTLEFKFKVKKAWIYNNKIDKATIKLIRYHDGEWQNLSTTLNTENETCIYYIAVSPGCSTFAVVGSKVVEKDESYGSELTIPWSIIFAIIILLTFILVIILIKARYIYLKDDSY